MTKPKAAAPKVVAAPKAAPKDPHAGHTTIDAAAWNEAKGAPVPFRLCSCGKHRPIEA